MAIINSYPLITPLNKDLLLGTEVYDPITQLPTGGSRTVTFSISSIIALISTATGAQSLQQVTNIDQVSGVSISTNNVKFSGQFLDSAGTVGTVDQILTSNATGNLIWSAADAGGTVTSVAASHAGNAFSASIGNVATVNPSVDITMNGITAQYVNGAGNLATLLDIPGLITNLTTTGTSGPSTLTSGVLNIPEYATTEIDTLATVTARGATTTVTSTFSGGIDSGGVNISNQFSGANAYLYVAGNGQSVQPTNPQGMAFVYNRSGGTRENELFFNPGIVTPAENATKSLHILNQYLDSDNGDAPTTPVSLVKLFGTGQLGLQSYGTGTPFTGTAVKNLSVNTDGTIIESALETLATVTARGASTSVASTFNGILTSAGTGADAYTYFTGNSFTGTVNEPPSNTFRNGLAQAWNNSGGSGEWETFWATGSGLANDAAGQASNAGSYISGFNRFAPSAITPIDTRMYKWYGNGELEILDMSGLPGGNARPTVSTPYITLPLSAGTNNSMLVRKSTKEVEFSASLSYNESNATLAILPASGTPSEIQMKSADNSIWKLAISNAGALVITGPF
tara:strand:- start:273 stop:1982 length:1710 start_codon:yes stop_codon:yes gene_type:complete